MLVALLNATGFLPEEAEDADGGKKQTEADRIRHKAGVDSRQIPLQYHHIIVHEYQLHYQVIPVTHVQETLTRNLHKKFAQVSGVKY